MLCYSLHPRTVAKSLQLYAHLFDGLTLGFADEELLEACFLEPVYCQKDKNYSVMRCNKIVIKEMTYTITQHGIKIVKFRTGNYRLPLSSLLISD